MPRKNDERTYSDETGKFATGNPGRPQGARNKTTRAVEELLEGEAEALTRAAINAALEGVIPALRLCLERICPARKDTPISFDLPEMTTAGDAAQAASAILAAVSNGDVTPVEGASAMALVEQFRRTLELTDIEARLSALEAMR